jgi:hypothetical protein
MNISSGSCELSYDSRVTSHDDASCVVWTSSSPASLGVGTRELDFGEWLEREMFRSSDGLDGHASGTNGDSLRSSSSWGEDESLLFADD